MAVAREWKRNAQRRKADGGSREEAGGPSSCQQATAALDRPAPLQHPAAYPVPAPHLHHARLQLADARHQLLQARSRVPAAPPRALPRHRRQPRRRLRALLLRAACRRLRAFLSALARCSSCRRARRLLRGRLLLLDALDLLPVGRNLLALLAQLRKGRWVGGQVGVAGEDGHTRAALQSAGVPVAAAQHPLPHCCPIPATPTHAHLVLFAAQRVVQQRRFGAQAAQQAQQAAAVVHAPLAAQGGWGGQSRCELRCGWLDVVECAALPAERPTAAASGASPPHTCSRAPTAAGPSAKPQRRPSCAQTQRTAACRRCARPGPAACGSVGRGRAPAGGGQGAGGQGGTSGESRLLAGSAQVALFHANNSGTPSSLLTPSQPPSRTAARGSSSSGGSRQ